MLAKLLIGSLAFGMSEQFHNLRDNEDNVFATESVSIPEVKVIYQDIRSASKLHVGMLVISLVTCLVYGSFVGYSHWTAKNDFMEHIRNLVIALFCRTFFTLLFDGVIILGSSGDLEGGNTLLAFECISQNLVLAFWLMLTIYLHARVQRKFNSEPTLILYKYGIPGVAVFFAFVWIFVLQAEFPYILWLPNIILQWITSSLRLLYLLIQLGLLVDMGRMMMKTSLDNDSVSLLRKSVAMLLALVFLFWLQFGLSLGRMSLRKTQSYQYFDYFIDGAQGGLVCLALFFFHMWVSTLLNKFPYVGTVSDGNASQAQEGIVTIDRLFVTENERWKNSDNAEETRDVVYSSVVEPHRLQKTLELYKRLNILPNNQVTVVDNEEYLDCQTDASIFSEIGDSEKAEFLSIISDDPKRQSLSTNNTNSLKINKTNETVQKKNAFYASKYLILEPKKSKIPKYLESRPSELLSEKKWSDEGKRNTELLTDLNPFSSNDFVKKWLNDLSENTLLDRKPKTTQPFEQHTTSPEKENNSNLLEIKSQSCLTPSSWITPNEAFTSQKPLNEKAQVVTETEIHPEKIPASDENVLTKDYNQQTEIISAQSEVPELSKDKPENFQEFKQPFERPQVVKTDKFERQASKSLEADTKPKEKQSIDVTPSKEYAKAVISQIDRPDAIQNSPVATYAEKLKATEKERTENDVKLPIQTQSFEELGGTKEPLYNNVQTRNHCTTTIQESFPSTFQKMQNPQKEQFEQPEISLMEDDISSKFNFSIERSESSTSSVSITQYYAQLKSAEEKIHSRFNSFPSAKKK